MGNNVTLVKNNGETLTFSNILGHQVGNGVVQILLRNGGSIIHDNWDNMVIILDDEQEKAFTEKLDKMEHPPEAETIAANDSPKKVESEKPTLKVVGPEEKDVNPDKGEDVDSNTRV